MAESYKNKDGDNVRIESDRTFISESLRNRVWEKCGSRCVKCGCTAEEALAKGEELQLNHIKSFKLGGETCFDNLNLKCTGCNIEGREQESKPRNRATGDDLTAKQAAFCREYVIDYNGTQAAIRAGYSVDTAQEIASENLSKPLIKARLEELEEEKNVKRDLTDEFILAGLKRKARTSQRDADQIRAYELLGKHKKLFTEQVEIKASIVPEIKEVEVRLAEGIKPASECTDTTPKV